MYLPFQDIHKLIETGQVDADLPISDAQIQPASMDLRLGTKAYRVRSSFLPGHKTTVATKLAELALYEIDLRQSAVLETGCVYVIPLMERLALASDITAIANPKSSTGRLDVLVRVIADGCRNFDQTPRGYCGALYLEVCPQTFPVRVRSGSRLVQLRWRTPAGKSGCPSSCALSVELENEGIVGYRAKNYARCVIDMDKEGAYAIRDFWEPVFAPERCVILDPGRFYIFASKQTVRVPSNFVAELAPFNPRMGEFRLHYAGFFDPGFGAEESRAVLEVRSHTVPFLLEDGQDMGYLDHAHLTEPSARPYGARVGSHYQGQGLRLSKHFTFPE